MDRASQPARRRHRRGDRAGDLRHRRFEVADLLVERDPPILHPLQSNRPHACQSRARSGHTQNAYEVAAAAEASLTPELLGCGGRRRRGGQAAERPEWRLVRMENGQNCSNIIPQLTYNDLKLN
jgi:hypothetical protein